MIPVKVCGITNVEDGKLAVNCGASAIGLIFYEKSPRYIHPEKAKEITRALPDSISKVGVFVNSPIDSINSIIEKDLSLLENQIHELNIPMIKHQQ